MPTPITTVTKTLTYKTPNEAWMTDDSEGKTGTVTYTGPDNIWVFVDNDTRKISPPYYTSKDDGPDIPVPPGMTRVMLSAESQTDLAVMAVLDRTLISEPDGYTETEEALPDGTVWIVGDPIHITTVHDLDTITYNFTSNTWEFEYRTSPITWTDVINARNGMLTASDGRIAPDMPESLKSQWIEFRQKLRDFPTIMGRGTPNEVAPWKCQLPKPPVE